MNLIWSVLSAQKEGDGGYRYISQLDEAYYRCMGESLTIYTYSISIKEIEFTQNL